MGNFELRKRYRENPFIHDMLVPMKNKMVRLSPLGQENNVLINQSTGEVRGTHVITYKKVDSSQFIKLFTQNIALTFDLGAAGVKAFLVLLWTMQREAISVDQVPLDLITLENFLNNNSVSPNGNPLVLSKATFKRGLLELEKNQIIARTVRPGVYFINPNFVFNGDRVAFTTIIDGANDSTNKSQSRNAREPVPLKVEHNDSSIDDKTADEVNLVSFL